jgi:hypothetical protein
MSSLLKFLSRNECMAAEAGSSGLVLNRVRRAIEQSSAAVGARNGDGLIHLKSLLNVEKAQCWLGLFQTFTRKFTPEVSSSAIVQM